MTAARARQARRRRRRGGRRRPRRRCSSEVDAADVGEHLGHVRRGRAGRHPPLRLHAGRATAAGAGRSPSPARPRQKAVTVDEVVLLPGDEAIIAPEWVPYRERIQPGDLSPGDLLPVEDDDPRLVPTYSFGDDPLDADDEGPGPRRSPRTSASAGSARSRSRAATWPPSAGTTATTAPTSPLAQSAPGQLRDLRLPGPARRPARPRCSASAPTATPTTTAGWSRSTTAAARTPRSQLAKKHEPQPLPEPVLDTLSRGRARDASEPGRAVAAQPSGAALALLAARSRRRRQYSRPKSAEPEAGQAGPQPPARAGVLRAGRRTAAARGSATSHSADADLDGADAVDVERARRRRRCRCGCRSRAVIGCSSRSSTGSTLVSHRSESRARSTSADCRSGSAGRCRRHQPSTRLWHDPPAASTGSSRSPSAARPSAARSAAGVVTFFTMAYIIVLNPLILGFAQDADGKFLGGGDAPEPGR